jgi:hypothetical protein
MVPEPMAVGVCAAEKADAQPFEVRTDHRNLFGIN